MFASVVLDLVFQY